MTPSVDIETLAAQNLPVLKRITRWLLWAQGVVYPLAWRMGQWVQYMKGTDVDNWSGAVSYAKGDQIIYNYAVYESLIGSNLGITPDTDANSWIKINNSFIGMAERAWFGGGRLNLEWALNRYFQTTFRQPDDPITPTPSQIYITNTAPQYVSFVSFTTEPLTSKVYTTQTSDFVFTKEVYGIATSYKFTIHIPLVKYNSLGSTPSIRESIVRQFADKYVVSGVYYEIVTY